jgi:hypothetical protein
LLGQTDDRCSIDGYEGELGQDEEDVQGYEQDERDEADGDVYLSRPGLCRGLLVDPVVGSITSIMHVWLRFR